MKIKLTLILSALLVCTFFTTSTLAQDSTKSKDKKINHGQFFVDEDGNGYNDNAPDHDGDGIPNGLDPDWQKLKNEKNKQKRKHRFVDLDGDGVNDNLQIGDHEKQKNEKQFNESGSSMEGKGKNQKGHGQKKHGKK